MNYQSTFALLAVSFLISSCSSYGKRSPSSDQKDSLSGIIEEISELQALRGGEKDICKYNYDQIYQRLFNLAGDLTYAELSDVNAIDEDIKSSFLARISLQESFKNFTGDSECLRSVTDVFRGLRYVEDYLIEIRIDKTGIAPADYVSLKGEFPYFLINPKYEQDFKSYEDLKSGDVILSRGNAYSSAAIARIGVNDYQFSHLSFVYKNPKTNELFTTEAHIEIGSVVAPLSLHIDSKNARSVVFRYHDSGTAHLASESIFNRVKAAQENKKNIEYDFAMNFKDDSRLFCSEIISTGFKTVLPREDYFPMFKSKFSPGIIPFLNKIGVPATKENVSKLDVFAPGDIQFDPRFEMVAEWRNPRKMEESRMKDFILTSLFTKMEKDGYKFDPSLNIDVKAQTFWLLRRLPVVKKFIENKFPINMNPGQLELFMALDKIGEAIFKDLEKISLDFDRPMTPKEIYQALDEIFKEDFELYKRYKKGLDVTRPSFHLLFHP